MITWAHNKRLPGGSARRLAVLLGLFAVGCGERRTDEGATQLAVGPEVVASAFTACAMAAEGATPVGLRLHLNLMVKNNLDPGTPKRRSTKEPVVVIVSATTSSKDARIPGLWREPEFSGAVQVIDRLAPGQSEAVSVPFRKIVDKSEHYYFQVVLRHDGRTDIFSFDVAGRDL